MKERLKWPIKATGTSIRQICKASSRGQLEHFAPRKGKNMNVNVEAPVGDNTPPPFEAPYFYIDAEGNRVEFAPSDGEAALAEVAYIAEDHADHVVEPATIH